jgi:O-antigen ligase
MSVVLMILRAIGVGLAWLGAVAVFVLSPAIGSIGSAVAVVAALLLSPRVFLRGSWAALRAQPAMLMFVASFAALTICFAITAREPGQVLFFANFLGMLLAPVVFLIAWRRPGERTIVIVCMLFALGTLVGALTGSYDVFIQHKERAIGWVSGGNLMARSVVPLGFMAVAAVIAVRASWRWAYLIALPLALYTLYLTGTRGVFVAIPVLGLIFVWFLLREFKVRRVWMVAGLGALVVAMGVVAIASPRFSSLWTLLYQVLFDRSAITDQATNLRLYMLEAGWVTWLKSPWIGFGWANFTDAAKPYGIYFFHNDFFDAAVAAGVVGIAAWLATLLAPIVGVLAMPKDRYSNVRLYCALILTTSFFIFGLTDMEFGYDLPTTLHAFFTAIVLGAFREPASPAVR